MKAIHYNVYVIMTLNMMAIHYYLYDVYMIYIYIEFIFV